MPENSRRRRPHRDRASFRDTEDFHAGISHAEILRGEVLCEPLAWRELAPDKPLRVTWATKRSPKVLELSNMNSGRVAPSHNSSRVRPSGTSWEHSPMIRQKPNVLQWHTSLFNASLLTGATTSNATGLERAPQRYRLTGRMGAISGWNSTSTSARAPRAPLPRMRTCMVACVPGCQGARVPGCQGARVPGCLAALAALAAYQAAWLAIS